MAAERLQCGAHPNRNDRTPGNQAHAAVYVLRNTNVKIGIGRLMF